MPDFNKKNSQGRRAPSFSVHDEIKRNRRLRKNESIRQVRTTTHKVFTVAVCIFFFVLTFAAIFFTVTRVDTVTVSGNSIYSAKDMISAAGIDGAVLPFVRTSEVEKKIISECPYVDSIELVKTYPSSVEIVVTEAKAMYVTEIRGSRYLLDSSLRVMGIDQSDDGLIELSLPEVSRALEGNVVEFYDEKSADMVPTFLESLFEDENSLQFTSVDLTRRFHLSATIGDRFKIKFGDSNHMSVKLSVAQQLVKRANEEQSKRTYIDISGFMDDEPPMVIPDYEGEF